MMVIARLVLCSFAWFVGCTSQAVVKSEKVSDAAPEAPVEIDQKLLFSLERSNEPVKKISGPSDIQVTLSSEKIYDGSILLIDFSIPESRQATADAKKAYKVVHEETEFPLIPVDEAAGTFVSVVAVPINFKPGTVNFQLIAGETKMTIPVDVLEGKYKAEKLRVDGKHVNPPKKDLKRIKRESAEIGMIYREIRRERLWSGPFILPVNSPITSPYGTKRVYNGEMQGFHQGLDLKAAVGTPIYAPAGGVVVLAKDLFFTGKTVILDHGYGIFTVYGHMSRLKTKKGKKVSPKTLLGLAGATGRASGPHLHWGAVLQRVKVNPLDLLRVLR
ncbi:MAG: M23 family metallopeptidase [Bdellovibrionales bacterium]|nr:M23 family metallopeptidase [Bdellovibrionales bacterium]